MLLDTFYRQRRTILLHFRKDTIEHDVFKEFMPDGDDPNADVLDLITIEGSVKLQGRIRILLERYRDVFATTLSPEPANISPFELEVDIDK